MSKELEKLEQNTQYEVDSVDLPPPDIVAYNELRSCADLYRMHQQKILDIQPEFQRDIVWLGPMQTRFIDSLVKQLPIPSMCFAYDYKKQKWIVIDGLQRMHTIVKFLKGGDWKLSKLDDVDPELAGKSVATIKDEESSSHEYYTRVENLSIPITVLRCDFGKKNHMEYLFTIFHRLNSGGMKLNNQEIRNCIYGGTLNNLLKELDNNADWRKINRMKPNETYRFSKQELILRFFAFEESYEKYTGYLAKYLNDYMHDNRILSEDQIERKRNIFNRTAKIIHDGIFAGKPPIKLSITVMEALLVGVGRNIDRLHEVTHAELNDRYQKLVRLEEFSEKSLIEGLSKKQRVIDRLAIAVMVLSGN